MNGRTVQAPAWLARLLTPLIARLVAREMLKKHPGLTREEIGERMRAELPSGSAPEAYAMVDHVVARLPQSPEAPAGEKAAAWSVWVLVAANLFPLYGVLAWDWQVFPLLALFWMENVIIGLLNVARMLAADPADPALWLAKLFYIPFFSVHYGFFTVGHGVFVLSGMFGGESGGVQGLDVLAPALNAARTYDLWLPIAALGASHLFSFFWNYLQRGEYLRASLSELMFKPYARVFVLHITIIGGGFAAMALGSPVWALVLLIGIKVGLDLAAHRKEHAQLQRA